ncbi:MAG TPA: DUF3450 family protein [Planctomycetota bacterium]|nr:DUF3450 family protein [Planctomycetota bacterium]HPF12629.1 DUF3450 family protein [Planctomycetota bacterium]HRV79783.1 DUF3450 family protein [Planctomycetota bacterium]
MKSPQSRPARPILQRLGLQVFVAIGVVAPLVSWYLPQGQPTSELDQARTSLEQLYETRRLISAERRDWQVNQQILQDEVDLAQREMATLKEQIAAKQAESAQAEARVAELTAEEDASRSAYQAIDETLSHWEERLRVLLPRLPRPLQDQVRALSQSLPSAGQEATVDRSKRFITVLFLLTQINKFHGDVTVGSEVLDLEDGTKAKVQTLYLGISQAFYVTNGGDRAGTGQSGERGWDWTQHNEAAASIARAIAIVNNEQPADFVPLPIVVQ